jgi:acyl-CoA thioester hydrolase
MAGSPEPWKESRALHVYVAHFRVRFSDLDPLGHVNNAVYLNFLEQAAIDHATLTGFGYDALKEQGGAFVARRHEITYMAPALGCDWLRVTTWPESMTGARAFRAYEMTRVAPQIAAQGLPPDKRFPRMETPPPTGDVVLTARTEWAFVLIETGRPRRMPEGLMEAFLDGSPG